jgi:hypothetical protein
LLFSLAGGLPSQLFAYRYGSDLVRIRRGGKVSEDVGGLIEGNYGPSIIQNDRRMDDEAGQEGPRTPRFCDFGGMSRHGVTIRKKCV